MLQQETIIKSHLYKELIMAKEVERMAIIHNGGIMQ